MGGHDKMGFSVGMLGRLVKIFVGGSVGDHSKMVEGGGRAGHIIVRESWRSSIIFCFKLKGNQIHFEHVVFRSHSIRELRQEFVVCAARMVAARRSGG